MDRIELDLPARPEYLAVVRSVVTELAEAATQLPAGRIDDLRLAVTEACANAIDATRRGDDADAHIVLSCAVDGVRLVVEVRDSAGGFDPDTLVPHPPVTKPDRLRFERGLGVPLMRALADEVTFERVGAGTMVRLVIGPAPR